MYVNGMCVQGSITPDFISAFICRLCANLQLHHNCELFCQHVRRMRKQPRTNGSLLCSATISVLSSEESRIKATFSDIFVCHTLV